MGSWRSSGGLACSRNELAGVVGEVLLANFLRNIWKAVVVLKLRISLSSVGKRGG